MLALNVFDLHANASVIVDPSGLLRISEHWSESEVPYFIKFAAYC